MSLMARFDRKIFVPDRIVLIFIMTTTTPTLLRKLRIRNVEMKAMNAVSLSDKLIVSFAVVSKDVRSSVMGPYPAAVTTVTTCSQIHASYHCLSLDAVCNYIARRQIMRLEETSNYIHSQDPHQVPCL